MQVFRIKRPTTRRSKGLVLGLLVLVQIVVLGLAINLGFSSEPLPDAVSTSNNPAAATTSNVLLVYNQASTEITRAKNTLRSWLPTSSYNITETTTEPTAATLVGKNIVVLLLPPSANNINDVKTFVNNGGSLLVISDIPTDAAPNGSANSYGSAFGLPVSSQDAVLGNCDRHHQVYTKNTIFGQTLETPVNVAASQVVNESSANSSTAVLKTRSQGGLTVFRAKSYGQGRVAVSGDANIWGGGCNYPNNQGFNNALFTWLRH